MNHESKQRREMKDGTEMNGAESEMHNDRGVCEKADWPNA
jgi:hypothetical protein